jgi:hypothetical protein
VTADQLAADRALALSALRPRQATPPAYDQLTDSGRAEVDRIVELIHRVRGERADIVRRLERLAISSGQAGQVAYAQAAAMVRGEIEGRTC